MKLHTDINNVDRIGVSAESKFAIKSSPKAFAILAANLYADKIAAIIRELACNAYDAHVRAGKSDVPFEIHLPTYLNPEFYVRDFGTGLSREQMIGHYEVDPVTGEQVHVPGLYQLFFGSDKTDTNDLVGALGLGSKTPLAYAESFTVESRYNGVLSVYAVFWNENREPAVALMAEQPTEDGNGFTVRLPVNNSSDQNAFWQKANVQLAYFNPAPTITGRALEIAPTKTFFDGGSWRFVQRPHGSYSRATVKQGPVVYPIDSTVFKQRLDQESSFVRDLFNESVDLEVAIGDVEVAPSREGLTYDARTVENLINLVKKVEKEAVERVVKAIQTSDTYFDACARYSAIITTSAQDQIPYTLRSLYKHALTSGQVSAEDLVWIDPKTGEQKEVVNSIELDFAQFGNSVFGVGRSSKGEQLPKYRWRLHHSPVKATSVAQGSGNIWVETGPFSILPRFGSHIVIADYDKNTSRGDRNRIISALTSHLFESSRAHKAQFVIEPYDVRSGMDVEEMMDAATIVSNALGGMPIVKLSDLGVTVNAVAAGKASKYKARPLDKSLRLSVDLAFSIYPSMCGSSNFSRGTYVAQDLDVTEGGLYVQIAGFKPVVCASAGSDAFYQFESTLDLVPVLMAVLNIPGFGYHELGKDRFKEIHFVNAKQLKAMKEAEQEGGGEWVSVFEVFVNNVVNVLENDEFAGIMMLNSSRVAENYYAPSMVAFAEEFGDRPVAKWIEHLYNVCKFKKLTSSQLSHDEKLERYAELVMNINSLSPTDEISAYDVDSYCNMRLAVVSSLIVKLGSAYDALRDAFTPLVENNTATNKSSYFIDVIAKMQDKANLSVRDIKEQFGDVVQSDHPFVRSMLNLMSHRENVKAQDVKDMLRVYDMIVES